MGQRKRRQWKLPAVMLLSVAALVSCSSNEGNGDEDDAVPIPATSLTYVAFAWNDLGMHCLNPTYDQAVLLPPYNTVWVQVVKRGDPPEIVTAGIRVDYAIHNNTYSYGKRSYGQFWDFMPQLFGASLPHDYGLNLEDPYIHHTLSGTMVVKGDHLQANGIPVVPVDDALVYNPYQIADITVRDSGTNAVLARNAGDRPDVRRVQLRQVPRRGPAPRRPRAARQRRRDQPGRRPARPLRLLSRQPGPRADGSGFCRPLPVRVHPRLSRVEGSRLL